MINARTGLTHALLLVLLCGWAPQAAWADDGPAAPRKPSTGSAGRKPASGSSAPRKPSDEERAKSALREAMSSAIDRVLREEAQRWRGLPEGTVRFSFKDADLATEVLPVLERQVGARISYEGPAKKLTIMFHQPAPWNEALFLVSKFTRTHVVQEEDGDIRLKRGHGGEPEEEKPPKPTRPPHVGRPTVPTRKIGGRGGTQTEAPQRWNPQRWSPPRWSPPRWNPPRWNPRWNPPRYQPPRNEPRYNPPRYEPPRYNPPRYNPPRYDPKRWNPPRYNPPKFNP
jgi:hypothetical protein